jgi:hypothetical protein
MAYKDLSDPRNKAAKLRHYYKNKQQYLDRNTAKKKEMEAIYREAKNRPCADCGVKYPPWVMQFDHLGDKTAEVRYFIGRGNVERMLAEIAKCDVVCANCHCQRTHDRHISAPKTVVSKEQEPTLF